ncbi:hypothetical protein ABT354_06340 [Streptomyces sp. NPDC000594]|uniref:hypothetical protein n=1 Tax=Streptomyces sp. NPDC000594 TaxID=3154261 RepID=UPI00331D121E
MCSAHDEVPSPITVLLGDGPEQPRADVGDGPEPRSSNSPRLRPGGPPGGLDLSGDLETVAARFTARFAPLRHDAEGARILDRALPGWFPWVRHLDGEEMPVFAGELLEALSEAVELAAGEAVHRTLVSWRATARINADPEDLREALRPLGGDALGPAKVSR